VIEPAGDPVADQVAHRPPDHAGEDGDDVVAEVGSRDDAAGRHARNRIRAVGDEALSFLRAVNTGHPGSITTIHANSPEGALEQLAMIAGQSGTDLGRDALGRYIGSVVDAIVQPGRADGRRRVTEVRLSPKT